MNNVIRVTELISQKVEDIPAIEALLLESDFSKEELMEIAITAAKVYEFSDVYDEFRQSLFESFSNTEQDEEGWYVRIFWPYTPDYMQEILSHPLLKILKALLECGLDPKLRLDNEDTDVMNELMYVDVPFLGAAAMRLLLEHGADPYIADSSGEELFVHLDSCMAIDIGLLPDSIVQVYFQCWLVLIGYGARPEKVDPFHLNPGHSYEELKEFEYFEWKIRYEADKGENIMHIIDIRTGTEIGYL